MRRFTYALTTTLLLGVDTVGLAAEEPRRLAALFVSRHELDLDFRKNIEKHGYATEWVRSDEVTADLLKQFNCVVLISLPDALPNGDIPPELEATGKMYRDYLAAGGGILGIFEQTLNQDSYAQSIAMNWFLNPLGVTVDNSGVVDQDPANLAVTRYMKIQLGWTNNFEQSPITTGVGGLYYQISPGRSVPSTNPLILNDPGWHPAVRAMKSAFTVLNDENANGHDPERRGRITEEPLIVAYSNGPGRRMVLYVHVPRLTFWGGYHTFLNIRPLEAERPHRSDGEHLFLNALDYVAKPSYDAGILGGFKLKPWGPLSKAERTKNIRRAPNWDEVQLPDAPKNDYLGLVGARTPNSTATNSIAEMCAAAEKAGYDFIVFADPLQFLDEEKFARTKAECRAQTTDSFLALPALEFFDSGGGQRMMIGHINFPLAEYITDDGKAIDQAFIYWFSERAPVHILLRADHSPAHPRMRKGYNSLAIYTYDHNGLIDDALAAYLHLQSQKHNLNPFAVHYVNSVDEVAAAAKTGFQTRVRADSNAELQRIMTPPNSWQYYRDPHPFYITEGPRLTYWAEINANPWCLTEPGFERWRTRARVESNKGLRTVAIHDSGQVYRQYTNPGTILDRTIDNYHSHQAFLTIFAEDTDGKRLISSTLWAMTMRMYYQQCGDRQNTLAGNYRWEEDTRYLGAIPAQYTGWASRVQPPFKDPDFAPYRRPYEGYERYSYNYGSNAIYLLEAVNMKNTGYRYLLRHCASRRAMIRASSDVQVEQAITESGYPEDVPLPTDKRPIQRQVPTRNATHHATITTFFQQYSYPTFNYVSGTVTLRRPVVPDPRVKIPITAMWGAMSPGEGGSFRQLVYTERGEQKTAEPAGQIVRLDKSDYFCRFPHMFSTVIVNLGAQPIYLDVGHSSDKHVAIAVGFRPQANLGTGQTLDYEVALVGLDLREAGDDSAAIVAKSLTDWGLTGAIPAFRPVATRGTVIRTEGILELAAADHAAVVSLDRTGLGQFLPLRVSGLAGNWQALYADLSARVFKPLRVLEGETYVVVEDLESANKTIFIGHPLICDPRLVVTLAGQGAAGVLVAQVHNPTVVAITSEWRINEDCGLPAAGGSLTLAPGATEIVTLGTSLSYSMLNR